MRRKITQFIRRKDLFSAEDRLLLAFSGGVDSVVLLHLLVETGFRPGVAHCNFSLRGEASDEDEIFARKTAKKYKLPFFCQKFETEKYAKENKVSIQIAARELRYSFFEKLLKTENYHKLLTAHHADDLTETVLYNLTKGSGIAGFRGILPKNGHLVRPFLFASKAEILTFAKKENLSWREDASNASDKYRRNFIRHQVVPLLREINPKVEAAFVRSAERARAAEILFQESIRETECQIMTLYGEIICLDLAKLRTIGQFRARLFGVLEKYGFDYETIDKLSSENRPAVGKIFRSASHELAVDRDVFTLLPFQSETEDSEILIPGNCEEFTFRNRAGEFKYALKINNRSTDFQISKSPDIVCVDAEKVSFPIKICAPKNGDKIRPMGMKGKKKLVNDLLGEVKIPLHLRQRIPVFWSGEEILWLSGQRAGENFKVSKKTTKVLIIKLIKK